MTTSFTSVAAARMTTAIVGPKDFSPPTARTLHGQFALGQEDEAADRVPIEGGELAEAGVHRARLRIQLA